MDEEDEDFYDPTDAVPLAQGPNDTQQSQQPEQPQQPQQPATENKEQNEDEEEEEIEVDDDEVSLPKRKPRLIHRID